MAVSKVTAEEFAAWLKVPAAFERALAMYGGVGVTVTTIMGRLGVGMLMAAAENAAKKGETPYNGPVLITPGHWGKLYLPTQDRVWWTGDFSILLPRGNSYGDPPQLTYFGVRFDPAGFQRMLDAAAKPSVSVNLGPSPIGAPHRESGAIPEEDKRPRVSDPALETWAAAFKKVYPDADQDFAWKSARGFFPDKQVGRDRVRALIPRPQGRPKEK